MGERGCVGCGEPINLRRADAMTCSPRCRKRASRRLTIPVELTSRARWVRRSVSKMPLTVNGRAASSTSPETWTDYKTAAASTVGVGLGFVLTGDGIGVLDLDHAIVDGMILPWAAEVLAANPGTFTEVSQSGEGLHVWGLLASARGRKVRDGRNIEVYSRGRYIALGTPLPGTSVELLPLNL